MEIAPRKEIKLFLNIDPGYSDLIFSDPQRFRKTLISLICKAARYTARGTVQISTVDCAASRTEESMPVTLGIHQIEQKSINMSTAASSPVSPLSSPSLSFNGSSAATLDPGVSVETLPRLVVDITDAQLNPRVFPSADNSSCAFCNEQDERKRDAWSRLEFPPCSIMVVDHFGDTHLGVKRALQKYNFAWVHLYDIRQLLESVQKYHPDLILLDLSHPDYDAAAAIQELREWERKIHDNAAKRGRAPQQANEPDEELQTIPVLAVAANLSEAQERQIIFSGCNDLVKKPITDRDLIQKIARHIPSWDSRSYEHGELTRIRQSMEETARKQWEEKRRLWILQCQMYSHAMVFQEIQTMAEEIQQFGIQTRVSLLEKWARKLILATQFYDMTEIKKLLTEFEALPV